MDVPSVPFSELERIFSLSFKSEIKSLTYLKSIDIKETKE